MFNPDQKLFEAARAAEAAGEPSSSVSVPIVSVPRVKRPSPWGEVLEVPVERPKKIKPFIKKATRAVLRETVFTGKARFRYAPKTLWRSAGLLMLGLVGANEYVDANFGARSDMAASASCSVTTQDKAGKQSTVSYNDRGWLSTVYSTYNACTDAVLATKQDNFVSLNVRQAWGIRGLENFLDREKAAAFGADVTMNDRSDALKVIKFAREEAPKAYLATVGRVMSLEYITYQGRTIPANTASWFGAQFEAAQQGIATGWNSTLESMKAKPAAPKPQG